MVDTDCPTRSLLALACSEGKFDRAKELLATGADPVRSRAGYFKWSPLHFTARQGRLDFAKVLISQYNCQPMVEDKEGRTPLHIACQHGHLDYVRYLVKQKRCDVQYGDVEDIIPLYHACGWLSECTDKQALAISRFLVSSARCNPKVIDMNGKNGVLHASEKGFLSVLKYFVEECNCNISAVDYRRNNTLHLAVSFSNNFDVVKYIIGLQKVDISSANNKNNNILHMMAIANSSLDVCKLILESTDSSTLESLLDGKNLLNQTPLDLARPELAHLLVSRYTVRNSQFYNKYALSLGMKLPNVSQLRIFVVGDTSAGKSTLIQSLQKETVSFSSSLSLSFSSHSQRSSPVVIEQAQLMVSTEFKSKLYGEVLFYDLKGSSESQYLQDVMLPHLIHPHLSVFLLVIDFSRPFKEVKSSFHYWEALLGRVCEEKIEKPKIILVGSHADVVKFYGKSHETKSSREKLKHLTIEDFSKDCEVITKVLLDCQRSESSGIHTIRKELSTLWEQTRDNNHLPFNGVCLLMYLRSNYGSSPAVCLETLIADVRAYVVEEGVVYDLRFFISDDTHTIVPLLDLLSDSGHLLFLKNEKYPSRSLIIPDIAHLFSELTQCVNCELKPIALKECHNHLLTSSNIERLFLDRDPQDMLHILSHLKLTVGNKGISKKLTTITTDEVVYYCPSLLTNHPPNDIWDPRSEYKFNFGWRMEANQCNQNFSLHFVHSLFLQLFSIVISSTEVGQFSLWKHGLYFECLEGFEFLVDTLDGSKTVTLVMRSKECSAACIKYRSIITRTIRDAFRKHYNHDEPVELIMDPFYSRQYPLLPQECLTFFDSRQVHAKIRTGNTIVNSEDHALISIEELLMFEPYTSIGRNCFSDLLEVEHRDIVTNRFLNNLANVITKNNSDNINIVATMFSVDGGQTVTAESLRVALHSDPTYQNVIHSINNYSSLDSTLLFSKRNQLNIF